MLDIKFIRENADLVKQNSKNRLAKVDIDRLLQIDSEKREIDKKIESMLEIRNKLSKTKPSPEQIEQVRELNSEIKILEPRSEELSKEMRTLRLQIPNLTHPEVFVSEDEDDNPILEVSKDPAHFDFPAKDHVELASLHDLIEFDRATKVSWAKFYYLKRDLALLEFALIQYALETVMKNGFVPFITPDLAKTEVLEWLWFQPRWDSTQIYSIENSDLNLIWTAEITMWWLHSWELLSEQELPKKYVAVSHCFRTEAWSYSKYAKWIFRVHQFTKIEMFVYCTPDKSQAHHLELLQMEKNIFSWLDIPFRVIDHCTADLWGPSIRTYDLEAWMPWKPNKEWGMGDYAEITSTSNCTDYQSRWLNIKYKDSEWKKLFVHTLNGTAIAITRAIIAIMENNQQKDWRIFIPKVLQKYMWKEYIG